MISWRLYYIKLLILNDIFYLHTWHHHQNIHYDKCNKTILLYWCSGRRHDSCVFQTCTRWYLWKKTYFEGHTCGNEIWNLRVQTERGATLEKVYNFPKRFSESYSYFKLLTNICVLEMSQWVTSIITCASDSVSRISRVTSAKEWPFNVGAAGIHVAVVNSGQTLIDI